jgi:hypothetical protein
MAFIKHEGAINSMDDFLVEIKKYLIKSGMFNNAVDFETLDIDKSDLRHAGFSIKHKEGKWFNFGRQLYPRSAGDNVLSISISRSGKPSASFHPYYDRMIIPYHPASTECGKYLFPLVNLYVTTTKTFVAFSAEIKKGQFVHFIVGRHLSYGGISGFDKDIGGEFVYITYMPDGNEFGVNVSSRFLGESYLHGRGYTLRPKYYRMARTVLYDGVPSQGREYRYTYDRWYREYENLLPSWVIYYDLAVPLNVRIKNGLIEMYEVQPVNIYDGSSKYNKRTPMNPHHLRLNVSTVAQTASRDDEQIDPDRAYSAAKSALEDWSIPNIIKDAEVFYNNEMCTLSIEDIEPAAQIGDWVFFPLVTKKTDDVFKNLWSSHIGIGFKFK